jgi:hypothetical protein
MAAFFPMSLPQSCAMTSSPSRTITISPRHPSPWLCRQFRHRPLPPRSCALAPVPHVLPQFLGCVVGHVAAKASMAFPGGSLAPSPASWPLQARNSFWRARAPRATTWFHCVGAQSALGPRRRRRESSPIKVVPAGRPLSAEMKALRGANTTAVMRHLSPIIRG